MISCRASCAPMQWCRPMPSARCLPGCERCRSMRSASGNCVSSRLAAPKRTLSRSPSRSAMPPKVVSRVTRRNMPCAGDSSRSTSSARLRSRRGSRRTVRERGRIFDQQLQPRGDGRRRRLVAGRQQVDRQHRELLAHVEVQLGIVCGPGNGGQQVVARLASPLLEQADEVMLHLDDEAGAFDFPLGRHHHAERLDDRVGPRLELRQVRSRHADQVGDHHHRQRMRKLADELDVGAVLQAIEQFARDAIDHGREFAHALCREQRLQEGTHAGVLWRIRGRARSRRQPAFVLVHVDDRLRNAAFAQCHRADAAGIEVRVADDFAAELERGHQVEPGLRHAVERGTGACRAVELVWALLDRRVHQVPGVQRACFARHGQFTAAARRRRAARCPACARRRGSPNSRSRCRRPRWRPRFRSSRREPFRPTPCRSRAPC